MTKLFTATWCAPCQKVKQVLQFLEHDVLVVDITDDPSELKALGARTVPALLLDGGAILFGEKLIIDKLREMFEKNLSL